MSTSLPLNDLGTWANWAQILGTIVPAVFALGVWKFHNCRVPWCHRTGRIPVRGTYVKVCEHHHRPEHHALLRRLHLDEHPELTQHDEP